MLHATREGLGMPHVIGSPGLSSAPRGVSLNRRLPNLMSHQARCTHACLRRTRAAVPVHATARWLRPPTRRVRVVSIACMATMTGFRAPQRADCPVKLPWPALGQFALALDSKLLVTFVE